MTPARKTVLVFRESDLSVIQDGEDHVWTWDLPNPGDPRTVDLDGILGLVKPDCEICVEMKAHQIQLLR